jgi:biotin carboxylase
LDKILLVIGGGIEAIPGIKYAKKLGIKVVVSDIDPNAPGFELADYKLIVSTYDYKETAILAKDFSDSIMKISGIISMAADVPYTVAFVSKKLNLSSNSIETAEFSSDKFLMKNIFKEKNIPIPYFWKITSLNELMDIEKLNGLPLVIKPLDGRGARGVLLISEKKELENAYKESLKFSKDSTLIVEQYLEGQQISTEALIIDSVGYPIGFCDRNYEFLQKFSPFIIENGGDMPTGLTNLEKNLVSKTAINAGIAMGVVNGVVKGDMVLTKDGPKVIEIATRLSGGWFSSDQIPLNSGIHIVEYAIKIALNIKFDATDLIPKIDAGVAIRYFFPNEGQISKIENLDILLDKDYIYKFELYVKEGDYIEKITDHTKRAGYVITIGKDKKEAVNRAEGIVNTIKIITK